jgi:hypothetical protein
VVRYTSLTVNFEYAYQAHALLWLLDLCAWKQRSQNGVTPSVPLILVELTERDQYSQIEDSFRKNRKKNPPISQK